jgi:MAPEG family
MAVAPGFDLRKERAATMLPITVAFPVATLLWLGIFYLMPPLAGMEALAARLIFALKCSCVAVLFCFLTGIEAVAHERLRSPAIDPLSDYETRRMRINLRYLQNTLEQLVLFVPGLFGLAVYSPDGASMRAVVASTVVWILARIAFWIGYHRCSAERGYGAPSMAVGILMLLYVCTRFGFQTAGWAGATGIVFLFGAAEAVITWKTGPVTSDAETGN